MVYEVATSLIRKRISILHMKYYFSMYFNYLPTGLILSKNARESTFSNYPANL